MQTPVLNEKQTKALKNIIAAGTANYGDFDGRAIRALKGRELVKVKKNSKGVFVMATAKGRKFAN